MQRLLRTFIDKLPSWVVLTDSDLTISYVNESAETLEELKPDILGKNLLELVLKGRNREELKRVSENLMRVGVWESEITLHRNSGITFPSHIRILALTDENGLQLGYAAIGTDISERKRLDARLLHTQRLESLGTLAGGIAHDFNNILGIIVGHAALLVRSKGNEKVIEESTRAIDKVAQRGAGIARQLLAFVRSSDAILQTVSVNEIIAEIIKLIAETFPKSISINTDLADNLPLIVADASQIHQVLLNLSLNARDAMPNGGILKFATSIVAGTYIRAHWPKADGIEYVKLSVSDAGTGMDVPTKERIFEPFFTTKEKDKGTGLGLAVVLGIIEKHNGFIDVQSRLGDGTTFDVFLPTPQVSLASVEDIEHRKSGQGAMETILCVDDEEMLLDLLKNELIRKGYNVLTAIDGMGAVEVYKRHFSKISLVLCDLGLPKLDGIQVFERMKWTNPSIKFVLCSGYMDADHRSQISNSGVKEFIQKPYGPDELIRKIQDVLQTG